MVVQSHSEVMAGPAWNQAVTPQSNAPPPTSPPHPPLPQGSALGVAASSEGCFHCYCPRCWPSLASTLSSCPAPWGHLTSEAVPNRLGWKTTRQVTD